MVFVIAIHIAVCVVLIILILIQSGRGGGLVEGFSNVESMFGPKTNTFLTRLTSILSILFFITCVSLAFISAQQSRSLMENARRQGSQEVTVTPAAQSAQKSTTAPQAPAQGAAPQAGTTQNAATPATAGQEGAKTAK